MKSLAFLLSPLEPWTAIVFVLISLKVAYSFLKIRNLVKGAKRKGYLPYKIFRSNDTGGNGVSKCVELDGIVSLEILFTEENVEVWILFH